MTGKKLWRKIHDRLFAVYGDCACPLVHRNAFQLLAAVMLSAQCRDSRVNQITPELFSLAPDAAAMAKIPVETIEEIIRPCGLAGNKSRNLRAAAQQIVDNFHGEVPRTMAELISLPGIGRKSANVLLGNIFGIPGFPVDTHVNRVLNRVGAVKSTVPAVIEEINNRMMPPGLWTNFSHLLIRHGRETCRAGHPVCDRCVLTEICRRNGVK